MDNLDPVKRQLVIAALKEQEILLRQARTGLRWWQLLAFAGAWCGLAWLLDRNPEITAHPGGIPLRAAFTLVLVPVLFLLAYIYFLHRRLNALLGLLGEKMLSQRTADEIRAISLIPVTSEPIADNPQTAASTTSSA